MRRFEQAMQERRAQERSDAEKWRTNRSERAKEHRRQIQRMWGEVYKTPEGKAELALHAGRMARLHRAKDVAQERHDAALVTRIEKLIETEIDRDARVLAQLAPGGRK